MLAKYGRDYFVRLRKRRKHYPKRGQIEDSPPTTIAPRYDGRWGGYIRALRYGPEQRSEWAQRGGLAALERYGKDYFREIRKKRKRYRKGYLTRKTLAHLKEKYKAMEKQDLWA